MNNTKRIRTACRPETKITFTWLELALILKRAGEVLQDDVINGFELHNDGLIILVHTDPDRLHNPYLNVLPESDLDPDERPLR